MNKIKYVIVMVIMAAVLLFSCKKQSKYEDEANFQAELIGITKGMRIVKFLNEEPQATLNIPSKIKGMPVTEIGQSALADNWFTHVSIPDTVEKIMDYSFSGNFIREINIPNKVTEIAAGAFMNNQLTSIVIPDSVRKIGYRAFANNWFKSITIGSDVEFEELSGYDTWDEKEWKYTAFEGSDFEDAYSENGRKAGTYTKVDEVWIFKPPVITEKSK